MTFQSHTPNGTASSSACDFESQPFGVLLGSWMADREITAYRPSESDAGVEPVDADEPATEGKIFGGQVELRDKISAYCARRRLNRAFRRDQRGFDDVLDAVANDSIAQSELRISWILGR